ncbi:MAG: hypothetical protein U0169_08400 [Polyangiaceae bacterium]
MRPALVVSLVALAGAVATLAPACLPASDSDGKDGGAGGTDASVDPSGDAGVDGGGGDGAPGDATSSADGADGRDAHDAAKRPPAALKFLGEGAAVIDPTAPYSPTAIGGVPPFSTAALRVTVTNDEMAPVTIRTLLVEPMAVTGGGGVTLPDEFAVSVPGSTTRKPFSLDGKVLAAGEGAEFGLHFLAYASGPRKARVVVVTSDDREASFVVEGRGRDNLAFSPNVAAPMERVLGRTKADFKVTGLASDGAGGVVYATNANEVLDMFSRDVVVAGVAGDGSQRWAKIWNESYQQESPDPGQNSESGGCADAIDYGGDGHVYVSARRSLASTNNAFQALVMKVKASDGSLAWAKGFTNGTKVDPDPGQSEQPYGIDASLSDRVLVTGESGGNDQELLLLAVSKTDGSTIFATSIKVASGYTDRGYTIRTDAAGNGYIGGISAGRAVLVRLSGLNGTTPAVTWVRDLGMGIGSNVNSLVLADNGDAIVSLDHRGAITKFAAARIKSDGSLGWAKTWDSGVDGDRNNTYFVRRNAGTVYVGGRIAVQAADTTHGDGFLLGLDATSGAYKFGALYYSGKGTERIAQHRVKGLVFSGSDVFGLTHGTTVQNNSNQYWGFWYQAPNDRLELPAGNGGQARGLSAHPRGSDLPDQGLTTLTNGRVHPIDTSAIWKDLPTGTFWGEPRGYEGETPQDHPLVSKLTLTP